MLEGEDEGGDEPPLLWLVVWALIIPLGVGLGIALQYFEIGDQTAARIWCRVLPEAGCP